MNKASQLGQHDLCVFGLNAEALVLISPSKFAEMLSSATVVALALTTWSMCEWRMANRFYTLGIGYAQDFD